MEKNVEVVRDKNKHRLIKIFYQLSLLIFVYGNNAWKFNKHDTKYMNWLTCTDPCLLLKIMVLRYFNYLISYISHSLLSNMAKCRVGISRNTFEFRISFSYHNTEERIHGIKLINQFKFQQDTQTAILHHCCASAALNQLVFHVHEIQLSSTWVLPLPAREESAC